VEWKDALLELEKQVEGWLHAYAEELGGFAVSVSPLDPAPDQMLLETRLPTGTKIVLEPARFAAHHLPTVVNLYAYPTLRRVRLVGPTANAWEVQSSQGVPMNYAWEKGDFLRLLTVLADESIPNSI
jgi:hypothetical protein